MSNLVEGILTSAWPATASTKMPDEGAAGSCALAMTASVPAIAMIDTNDATRMLRMEPPLSHRSRGLTFHTRHGVTRPRSRPSGCRFGAARPSAHPPRLAAALRARRGQPPRPSSASFLTCGWVTLTPLYNTCTGLRDNKVPQSRQCKGGHPQHRLRWRLGAGGCEARGRETVAPSSGIMSSAGDLRDTSCGHISGSVCPCFRTEEIPSVVSHGEVAERLKAAVC
jgi:hypothetical protein